MVPDPCAHLVQCDPCDQCRHVKATCVLYVCGQVPEDEDDTCELELPSPLDMAEMVSSREEAVRRPQHLRTPQLHQCLPCHNSICCAYGSVCHARCA